MRIAITGSNGFIGEELVKYMLATGHQVILLQRKRPALLPGGTSFQPYDLNWPERLLDLNGVDALVHTAFMPFTANSNASNINIQSTLRLFNQCSEKGVQFIFLSSMSAHEDALSEYGKHKFKLEQKLDASKCLILKPGLVIGNKGLFKRIYNSVKKTPFTVLVAGGKQPIQPVYVQDLVKVIADCITAEQQGKFVVAVNKAYTMKDLFAIIAAKAGKRPLFISVPYWLVSLGIGLVNLLRLPFPVSKENLLGLQQLKAVDTANDLKKLNANLRSLEESIKQL